MGFWKSAKRERQFETLASEAQVAEFGSPDTPRRIGAEWDNDPNRRGGTANSLLIAGVEREFRWIPPGNFVMGLPGPANYCRYMDGFELCAPMRKVRLSRGFWLLSTPVTQELWRAATETNPSFFKGDDRPVENVSWNDCRKFLASLTNLAPPPRGWRWDLPTEAQWEYAARSGTARLFSWGDKVDWLKANCRPNPKYPTKIEPIGETTPVGRYQPNEWGLSDMCGNVYEWVKDFMGQYPDDASKFPTNEDVDPFRGDSGDLPQFIDSKWTWASEGTGTARVARGGSWNCQIDMCCCMWRDCAPPEERNNECGVRVALVADLS